MIYYIKQRIYKHGLHHATIINLYIYKYSQGFWVDRAMGQVGNVPSISYLTWRSVSDSPALCNESMSLIIFFTWTCARLFCMYAIQNPPIATSSEVARAISFLKLWPSSVMNENQLSDAHIEKYIAARNYINFPFVEWVEWCCFTTFSGN